MTPDSRLRLEAAVVRCCDILVGGVVFHRVHLARPTLFAEMIASYIPLNHNLRDQLDLDDFIGHSFREQVSIVKATIRRLQRKGKLRKRCTDVKVQLFDPSFGPTDRKKLVTRRYTYYESTNALDRLAEV